MSFYYSEPVDSGPVDRDDYYEVFGVRHNDDEGSNDDDEIISAGSESDIELENGKNGKESFLGSFFNSMKKSLISIRKSANIFLNKSINENDDTDNYINPEYTQVSDKDTKSLDSPESKKLTTSDLIKYKKITDSIKTSGVTPVKWNIVDNELKKLNDNIEKYKKLQDKLSRRNSKSIKQILGSESGVSLDDTKLISDIISDIIDKFETVYDENQNLLNNVNVIMENDLELNETVKLLYNKQQSRQTERLEKKKREEKKREEKMLQKTSKTKIKSKVHRSSKRTMVSKRVHETTNENKNMKMTEEQIKQLLIGVINGNVKSKKLKDYIIYLTKNLNDTNNTTTQKSEKNITTIVTMVDKSGMRNFMTENKSNVKVLTSIFGNSILSKLDKKGKNYCYLCGKEIDAGGAEVEHKCPAVVLLLLVDKLEHNSDYKKYEYDLENNTNINNLLYEIYTNLNGPQTDYTKLERTKKELENELKSKGYNYDFIELLFQNINMYAYSHKYCNQVKSDLRFMKWNFKNKSKKCTGLGCFVVEGKNITNFNKSAYEFSNYVNEHTTSFIKSTDKNSYVSKNNAVSEKASPIFKLSNHPLFDPSRDGTNTLISKISMNNIKKMEKVDIIVNEKKLNSHFNYIAKDYNTNFIKKKEYPFSEIINIIEPNLENLIINKLKKKKLEKKKKRKYKENDKGSSKRHRGGKKFSIKTRKNKKI